MRIVCIGEFRNGDSSKMCKITWMSPRVHEARLSLFSRFLRFVDLKCKFNEGMVHKEILFMRVAYPGECVIRQCKCVNIEQIVREIKPFSMCCALRSTVFFSGDRFSLAFSAFRQNVYIYINKQIFFFPLYFQTSWEYIPDRHAYDVYFERSEIRCNDARKKRKYCQHQWCTKQRKHGF